MIPKIKKLKPLENYLLEVTFDDGRTGIYDVNDDINNIYQYRDLKNITTLFAQVKLD